MSKLSKKLLMSVLTLVLTLAALGTTTFAWFTLGNEASVGQIDTKVTAGDGLEIRLVADGSAAATGWYNAIPSKVINDYVAAKYTGENALLLSAVTSANGVDMALIGQSVALKNQYLELTFEFRSQKEGNVYLDTFTLTSGAKNWKSDLAFQGAYGPIAKDADVSIDAASAVRFSLQVEDAKKAVTYENAAVASLNTVLGSPEKAELEELLTKGAHAYYNAKSALADQIKVAHYVQVVNTLTAPAAKRDADDALIDANALFIFPADPDAKTDGYYTRTVTLRLWLEGWDIDTYNSIFNREIALTLSFVKEN